jgi:molybdopterin-containing oxidoreductase family iron-sulfur binding subunit
LKEGKRIGRDVVPACVEACPAEARAFGDMEDVKSEVSRLLSERRPLRLREEMGTECKVYYLLK